MSIQSGQVGQSHDKCEFCNQLFKQMDERQQQQLRKQLLQRGANYIENKEEEFFKMSLLSYQINNKQNMKILKLDAKSLYKQVSEQQKLPFFQWNDWLKVCIERLQFEQIYKKTSEFEYAKLLSQRFQVQESYF
mmetsp:Transcript_3882/g.6600  ORF Transcript_3882/g.6600 Transcript_3882/m.6600 type:complete len:134 (-) Transcript_3882:37-438(-)